jgi:hypothetical protein
MLPKRSCNCEKLFLILVFHATTLLYSFATINLLIEKGENNEIKLVYCSIDEMLIGENKRCGKVENMGFFYYEVYDVSFSIEKMTLRKLTHEKDM